MVVIVLSAVLKASSKVPFLQWGLGQSWPSSLASDHCQGWLDFELLKAWEPHANYAKLIAI